MADTDSDDEYRRVHLPLSQNDNKCAACHKSVPKIKLCSGCKERVYCSGACQKEDWKFHKSYCGKTEGLDLDAFRPLLAWMANVSHIHRDKPIHFAMLHKIINNCNPDTPWVELSDGRQARLVVVDDRQPPIFPYSDPMVWWPLAQSAPVARKMQRRILYTGYVLPILTAVAGSLLSEIYTTTSRAGSHDKRVRLQYRSSPIADFGICRGAARVVAEDRLVFYSMKTRKFIGDQDPKDHYWLYFTSVKGEEVYLDFSMYPFNFTHLVNTVGYPPPQQAGVVTSVPCFWSERELRKRNLSLYTEQDRVSVLRNTKLQEAMQHCSNHMTDWDLNVFHIFMEAFSKKNLTATEKALFNSWLWESCRTLGEVLDTQLYKTYPKEPQTAFELDPNETLDGA